ncbi:MAG: metallophosphoesterase [Bacteroidia bacterium]|nr:metallophosphoesterase [Bacteroidia bacterium]
MRLIQLSDIHLSKDNLTNLKNFYIEALKKDLKDFHNTKPVDLILITGDLVDKGGISFGVDNPYEIFINEFVIPISSELNIPKDKVLFVPGNHDIDRNEIDEIYEEGLIGKLKTIESVNQHIENNKKGFTVSNKRIQKFKDFERDYHKDTINYHYSNNESIFIQEYGSHKIGFLLMNDSWRCSNELKVENHFVGINQLFNAKNIFDKDKTDINIVLFHHPIEFFNETERGEIKNILQKFNFELVICGHTHKSNLNFNHGVSGNALFLNAKSAFNNPREDLLKYQPGYHIIDIDPNSLDLICNFRTYIHSRYEFDKDTNSAPDGKYVDKLVARNDKKKHYALYELANKTNDSHIDDFNNALVIFKTNTIAPKDVNSLFVLPKLTEKPTALGTGDESKAYTLAELIIEKQNVLLFGSKESGKSTLLNKISIECSNQFNLFKRIPIVIDYKTLDKDEVLVAIRRYLNETKERVEELVKNGQILLLLDNIVESEKYKYAKNHLNYFITTYPTNKVIAATSENFDELIQNENSIISKFHLKPVFIGLVGVTEFKDLVTKWFNTKDKEWHRENIEKLIKVFEILRIPRTFFSISLFLWIIEKQEGFKPINKNYLLNKFLQFILEGLVTEEAKSGSFNFDRKKEILSEIAYAMYQGGSELENYSLNKDEIIDVISEYFKKNQRGNDPNDAYKLFYDKGIFKIDTFNDKISFRFESFFQFFLSLNIETNKEFRDIVFSEKDVLSFIDELDYYSGRHQNDKTTLVFAKNLLIKSFSELDTFIEDDTDKYFPKKSFILNSVDPNKFHPEIKKNKLTDAEIDEVLDNQMSMLPVDDSIKVKQKYNYKTHFPLALELTARVLKNAENIQDPELINETLDTIIQKTAKYGVYLQSVMVQHFKENNENEFPIPPEMLISLAPMINQLMLLNWIGTEFLQVPLEKKLNRYILDNKKKQRNEYEHFLTNFVYADLKLKDYPHYTNLAIKYLDNKYFAELYFFKILINYMMRPEGSELLPDLELQMINLLGKARGFSKEQAKKVVEKGIREKKNESQTQMKIDL